jgi:hypothetical protein
MHYYGDYNNTRYTYAPIEDMDKGTNADTDTENKQSIHSSQIAFQYQVLVSAVLFVIGTTGNVMLIIIITCNKEMRTVPNMYILNLAISDIIYLTVLLLDDVRYRIPITWLNGEIGCAFFAFWNRMSVGLTAYSVAVLSFQRYRVTVNPLHVHVCSQPTRRGTGAIICGVWILAALFAIPAVRSPYLCVASAMLWFKSYYKRLCLFQLLVSCVFPLCVIAFSYIMTSRLLLKSADPILVETQNPQLNTRTNTVKVVLGLVVIFLISYVPYHIWLVCYSYTTSFNTGVSNLDDIFVYMHNLSKIMPILKLFLSINSCLNPVALFCTSHDFRKQFKRYLTCCCKTKSPPTDFELAIRN